jgi:Putative  PD-(D/E)XK family member, (DUF4420)
MTWAERAKMTLIEQLWSTIGDQPGAPGSFRLVDESHPLDLYAGFDQNNRRLLMLVTQYPPDELPATGAVQVSLNRRNDGHFAVLFSLARTELNELFGRLCQDLIDATRASSQESGASAMLLRLGRWRRLLEPGGSGLSDSELRGLFGELWFLRTVAMPVFGKTEAVDAWNGPFGAPQDFQLGSGLVEIKTILLGNHKITISSADQLDSGSTPLQLAVIAMHPSREISLPELISNIRGDLEDTPHAAAEFDLRLAEAGYIDCPEYHNVRLSVDEIRYYPVADSFPRITTVQVPAGISKLTYDLDLHECGEFRSEYIHGSV